MQKTNINEADIKQHRRKNNLSIFIVAIETPQSSLLLVVGFLHILYLEMQISFHELLLYFFHLYLQYCYL